MRPDRPLGAAADARPHCLLDHVLLCQHLKNDAELCRVLRLAPSSISKIRHGRTAISADVLLRVHEAFGIPVAELRRLEAEHQSPALRRGG